MRLWYPDICPSGQCVIEISGNTDEFARYLTLCPHHQKVKDDNALQEQAVHAAVVQSNRVREAARDAAKQSLGLDKEHPGVSYRNELDGSFTLGVDQKGEQMPEWPTDKGKLTDDVAEAVSKVTKPAGTSDVRLA